MCRWVVGGGGGCVENMSVWGLEDRSVQNSSQKMGYLQNSLEREREITEREREREREREGGGTSTTYL